MTPDDPDGGSSRSLSRRRFLSVGGSAVAGACLPAHSLASVSGLSGDGSGKPVEEVEETNRVQIKKTYILGRTGFKVSDISMGCGLGPAPELIRSCYDRGVNYFDTAENYANRASETNIGKAMAFFNRDKVFITSKLNVRAKDTEERLLDRFSESLERLRTDYLDAWMMHSVSNVELLDNAVYHKVVRRLRSDGKLRFAGVSSHGAGSKDGDSMEKVLVAAAEDPRFDVLLLSYNFMNRSAAEKVLAACKRNNVGATAMKTFPGILKEVPPFDPENPSPEFLPQIRKRRASGMSPEQINRAVRGWANYRNKRHKATQQIMQRYGMQTERQLWQASIKWARSNPDVHTLCVSMTDFAEIEQAIGLSGSVLTGKEWDLLGDYEVGFSDQYCRHGCSECLKNCHKDVPINTILRYACYFGQGREEHASEKYQALGDRNAAQCGCCDAPCQVLCPYGLDIQNALLNAHGTLAIT